MSDLISKDALFKAFEDAEWYCNDDRDCIAESLLEEAPTIDAVPVRCAECKYFWLHPSRVFEANAGQCENYLHVGGVKVKSDFCSYGKRKGDEDAESNT